jgi:hypothetical protein
MTYDYDLWLRRGKQNRITPFWAALATIIFSPLGYWFNGDGYRGLKYTAVIFFTGYVTLSIATFIGSAILAWHVYRVSTRHEARFANEKGSIDYSNLGWIIKLVMVSFVILFGVFSFLFFSLI